MLLSEVQNCQFVIDDNESSKYQVEFSKEIFENGILNIKFYYKKNHAGFTLSHPSMREVKDKVLNFKHYLWNGGKFWTHSNGMEFTLSIPIEKIELLPIKGYSYVKTVINGIPVSLNVSGGTRNGWTDSVYETSASSVNVNIRDMKKIMEVAIIPPGEHFENPRKKQAEDFVFYELKRDETEEELNGNREDYLAFKLQTVGSGKKSWCQNVIKNFHPGKRMYISKNTLKGREVLRKKVWGEVMKENLGKYTSLNFSPKTP